MFKNPFKMSTDSTIRTKEAKFVPKMVFKACLYPPFRPALATNNITGPGVAIMTTTAVQYNASSNTFTIEKPFPPVTLANS